MNPIQHLKIYDDICRPYRHDLKTDAKTPIRTDSSNCSPTHLVEENPVTREDKPKWLTGTALLAAS